MCKYTIIFIMVIIILLITIIGTNIIIVFALNTANSIAVINTCVTLIGAVLASGVIFYQLKENNEWGKRHTALVETIRVHNDEGVLDAQQALNKSMDYHNRRTPYTLDEIHSKLCGNPNYNESILELTEEGRQIKKNIITVLNYYEYIATAIKNGIFEEYVVKDLENKRLIKTYYVFSIYICHLRSSRHYNDLNAFKNLETIANKWQSKSIQDLITC